jgi:hypothetical protein
VFGTDTVVSEPPRLAPRDLERFLCARRERDATGTHPLKCPSAEGRLDRLAHGGEVDPDRGQRIRVSVAAPASDSPGDRVAELFDADPGLSEDAGREAVKLGRSAEEQVFGADPAVSQGARLFLRSARAPRARDR